MLTKIEQISKVAQTTISEQLSNLDSSAQKYKNLQALKTAYAQLDKLIQTAKDENATIGMYILCSQLSETEGELNAAVLLRNFLKVMNYSTEMASILTPRGESKWESILVFSLFPVAVILFVCSAFPAILQGLLFSGLWLPLCALPLLIIYAQDEPFSMSRLYQEIAAIEKTFADFNLGGMLLLLLLITAPEVTLLLFATLMISFLSLSLAFWWHSNHLQSKHESLKAVTSNIQHVLGTHSSVLSFFKTPAAERSSSDSDLCEVEQTLAGISRYLSQCSI